MDNKAKTTIRSRTIDYSLEAWKYYSRLDAEIFKWDGKIDGEDQYGIRIHQIQRTGYITPVMNYGFKQENESLSKGSAEMLDDGDMPEYTSLYA